MTPAGGNESGQGSRFPRLRVAGAVDRLAVVPGDQLDLDSGLLRSLDRGRDAVLMMEVAGEATQVPCHRQRVVQFLAAMRHFAVELSRRGYRVHYVRLDDRGNTQSFAGELAGAARALRPARVASVRPGEWRLRRCLEEFAAGQGLPYDILEDDHFLTTPQAFGEWMAGRSQPVMEHFYRRQRRVLGVLLDADGQPAGGEWNFDRRNRQAFTGSPDPPAPFVPRTDAITREVIRMVERRFADLPGRLSRFRWPVTRRQALRALADFTERRLPRFGTYQDAMWSGEPFLFHSLLSPALNLKLLNPRECVAAAIAAFEAGAAPLNSVEGFVRQLIGWREFIRGVYWHEGPEYGRRNALDQHGALPGFYWTGETDLRCLRECLGQVIEHGYGHHIQRLMVTGNFALLAGVHPRAISDWYLGMYVDAVEWVTLPNTLGMVMHADGGVVGTKPYAASGKYIQRMSNYCAGCPYDPKQRTGDGACPFNTFYWDFLIRHRERFRSNRRMAMMLGNVDRLGDAERSVLRAAAAARREELGIG